MIYHKRTTAVQLLLKTMLSKQFKAVLMCISRLNTIQSLSRRHIQTQMFKVLFISMAGQMPVISPEIILGMGSTSQRRRYIANCLSLAEPIPRITPTNWFHWLRPCSAIDRKRAQLRAAVLRVHQQLNIYMYNTLFTMKTIHKSGIIWRTYEYVTMEMS